MKYLEAKLLLSLLLFTIIIVSVIALTNRHLLVQDMKQQQYESRALIESHILSDMQKVDEAHSYNNRTYFEQMKTELFYLQNYYESNPDVYSWDMQEIYDRTRMDLNIIDVQNKIVVSTDERGIGLDLTKCCVRFASFLDESRQRDDFYSNGIENAEVTKDLWKYSFIPTKDHRYILELGGELEDSPIFKNFNFFDTAESLIRQYKDLNNIEMISDEGFFLQTRNDVKTIDELSPKIKKVYQKATETEQPTEVIVRFNGGKKETHRFIPYHSVNEQGNSTKRIVYVQYSNHIELQLVNKKTQQFWLLLVVGIVTTGILFVIIMRILKETIRLATFDSLTGVYNRTSYIEYMDRLVQKKNKVQIGLLLIDLDNFKLVNDQFGHLEGDEVLKEIAHILQQAIGEKGIVVRFGGDEFGIVMDDATEQKLHQLANDILTNVRQKQQEHSIWQHLSISIGGTIQKTPQEREVSIFMRGDRALYQSKYMGKDQYSYITPN
ncbi:GGDEF domain-containing protein [Solibacillus sp. FSL K6-1523]|uniref:GGDEF domain-containing protein n=1 Tax=Solibacillus sp. FSL K6-1523 TaxID=2921471 RepID=UPI0030F60FDE